MTFSCSPHSVKKDIIIDDQKKEKKIEKNILHKEKRSEIKKEKLNMLSKSKDDYSSVIFEFRKERYLEGVDSQEVSDKINFSEKALQATFKMLTKAPTTGMEHLNLRENSRNRAKLLWDPTKIAKQYLEIYRSK